MTTGRDVPAVPLHGPGSPGDRVARVRTALADIAAGRPMVVVDDENRENDGGLVLAAELATPELVAFTDHGCQVEACVLG